MSEQQPNYDVFLPGELVDLVVPNERAIHVNGWYNWFNDQGVTRHLKQGLFPNTRAQQLEFMRATEARTDRLNLLIKPKEKDFVVGVCSLSSISHVTRQADFAMVIGRRSPEFKSAFYGMEAKCLMTEHAFEALGLERINSSQSAQLKDWQRWQILFGYKMEGIKRKAERKGYHSTDVLISGCLLEDYLKLKQLRGGRLWPGQEKIMELIRDLPKESLEEKLNPLIQETVDAHYAQIRMT